MVSSILVAASVGAIVIITYAWLRSTNKLPTGSSLPPGPKGWPLLGNLPDIPPVHSWFQFQKWGAEFGPLYELNLAGQKHVIVSDESIAIDLLRERGNIYSSRPELPMAAQLMSDNLRPVFLPYNNSWRNGRKLMHALANTRISADYEPVQEEESLRVVYDLIRDPQNYERWFQRYSAGLIMRLAYGLEVYTGEEDFVKRILAVVHNVERVASPGAYLVDTFPILMHLPDFLAPFKREGKRLHREELDLFVGLIRDVEKKQERGEMKQENFTTRWLAAKDQYGGLTDDEAAYVIGTLFEAGSSTTAAAMMSFMLAIVLHPEEYLKLQKELDNVVGHARLPLFTDMEHLPRVRAVTKEVLRWRPVTAGGFPHTLTRDDTYTLPSGQSVFLAAGTAVHPVQWTIHRDASLYPDPDSFIPDRWLTPEYPTTFREPASTYPNLQNFSAFGFGRRICPGQNIAERSLYILIARIAWCCDLGKKRDGEGREISPPEWDYTAGFNTQPKTFAFELRGREGREVVVDREWEGAWGRRTREHVGVRE